VQCLDRKCHPDAAYKPRGGLGACTCVSL